MEEKVCSPRELVDLMAGLGWSATEAPGYTGVHLADSAGELSVRVSWVGSWIRAEMGPWTSRFRSRWIRRALVINRDTLGVRFAANKDGSICVVGQVPGTYSNREIAEFVERMARYVRHYADYLGIQDSLRDSR